MHALKKKLNLFSLYTLHLLAVLFQLYTIDRRYCSLLIYRQKILLKSTIIQPKREFSL